MNRRQAIGVVIAGLSAPLVGCNQSGPGGAGSSTDTGTTGGDAGARLKVGMATDTGGIGDQSFNMMAWNGLQQAEKELGAEVVKVESQQVSDYSPNLRRLAERGCKLVFAVGFAL